jgi:hypothetical protein
MFGIPEWAIGVATVLAFVSVLKIVTVRLLPPEARAGRWKRGPLPLPDDVQERLAELDDLKQRMVELEERVDFAERILAKRREAEPLPPG